MTARALWTGFATAAFCSTAWFASTTFSDNETGYKISSRSNASSFANTVTVLRVAQGVTSWLTTNSVAASLEATMWALSASETGCPILTLLILSPTTSLLGVFKLLCSRATTRVARVCGLARLLLVACCTVGCLVLFINTSVTTWHHPVSTSSVIAGTGPFNGSLVRPFLDRFGSQVPYFALASTYDFIQNPKFSVSLQPSACAGGMTPCDSYLLPGGTYLMWPSFNGPVPVGSVLAIKEAPAMRIDFAEGLDPRDNFFPSAQCHVFGEGRSAVQFCLDDSSVLDGSLKTGVYVCDDGVKGGKCITGASASAHNVTLTFAVSDYLASCIASVQNNTILSVSEMRAKKRMARVDKDALSLAVGWLLDNKAADLPAQSSVNYEFWQTGPEAYRAIWEADSRHVLKSILAFMLWEFTTNNNGNAAVQDTESNGSAPDLPPEFHTTASVCHPYTRFVINKSAFTAYVVVQSLVLLCCWIVALSTAATSRPTPVTTSFPAVDFAGKLRRVQSLNEGLFEDIQREYGDEKTRSVLGRVRVTSQNKKPVEQAIGRKTGTKIERRLTWA